MLHVSAVGLSEAQVGSFDWHVSNVIDCMCRFCVPVFVMISGAIFLKRETSMKKYIKRLLYALAFWTVTYTFYASITKIISGEFCIWNYIKALFYPTHLWFLWMILPLYLAVSIFRAIVKDRKSLDLFLILWLAFGIIVPAAQHLPVVGGLVTSMVDQTHFFLVLEYGGYFILGYYLSNFSMPCIEKYSLLYILCGVVVSIVGTFLVSSSTGKTSELFLGYMFPTSLLTSVGVFLYVKRHVAEWKISPHVLGLVSFISTCSLGIYAVHMFFLVAFNKMGITFAICNPIVSIPTVCAVILAVSMGFIYLVKHYLPGGKYIA